jgi:hypothetical protein
MIDVEPSISLTVISGSMLSVRRTLDELLHLHVLQDTPDDRVGQ